MRIEIPKDIDVIDIRPYCEELVKQSKREMAQEIIGRFKAGIRLINDQYNASLVHKNLVTTTFEDCINVVEKVGGRMSEPILDKYVNDAENAICEIFYKGYNKAIDDCKELVDGLLNTYSIFDLCRDNVGVNNVVSELKYLISDFEQLKGE